jgi:hypothetical protein
MIEHSRQRDKAIYTALEQHGYSKEWFFDPAHMDRICITLITHPGDTNETLVYEVDGVRLFAVMSRIYFDPVEMKVNISVKVQHFEK